MLIIQPFQEKSSKTSPYISVGYEKGAKKDKKMPL
jgi:hypothetical protein